MIAELFVLLLCLTLLPIVFVGYGRLRLEKDYFLMLFLFFGAIYVFVDPALVHIGGDGAIVDGHESYPKLQALVIVLFLLPLGLTYRILKNRFCNAEPRQLEFYLNETKVILFCIFFFSFEIAFTVLAFMSNMYARRIGTEVIAEVVGGLDVLSLAVLRTHDLIVLPEIALLLILMPSIKRQMRAPVRFLAYGTFMFIVLSFIVFAVMNSRALLIFLAMALLFANLLTGRAKIMPSGGVVLLTAATVFYGMIVVSNIRNHGIEADMLDVLNPASIISETDSHAFSAAEWMGRLDCIDLIAQMDSSLQRNGYEWGGAWERPLVSTLGSIIGLDLAVKYKTEAITTAKTYLMERHTDIATKDYPSCMVTDLWGNFWIFGLPAASMLIATCFVLLRYGLTISRSPAVFVISLVFAFYIVVFEKEFFDWAFGWIKLIPAIVLLVLFNPIIAISERKRFFC